MYLTLLRGECTGETHGIRLDPSAIAVMTLDNRTLAWLAAHGFGREGTWRKTRLWALLTDDPHEAPAPHVVAQRKVTLAPRDKAKVQAILHGR